MVSCWCYVVRGVYPSSEVEYYQLTVFPYC